MTDIDTAGDTLECDIPSDIIDPIAQPQIIEVCLFTDDSPALYMLHSDVLEITSIEPSVIFKNLFKVLESSNENIKIFISSLPQFTAKIDCKYNNIILTSLGTGEDELGNKYILCPVPLFPNFEGSLNVGNKSIIIEILSCGESIFTASSTSLHTLNILDVPTIDTSSQMYIPRFIPYPINGVIDDADKLIITGQNFDPSLTYYCVFKYGLSTLKEIIAEYIDSNNVKCRPLDFDYETFIDLKVKAVFGTTSSFAYGTISIFLYEMPYIQKIFPTFAAYDQEIEVSVSIDYLPYIHNVHCKFGISSSTLVTIYRQGKHII